MTTTLVIDHMQVPVELGGRSRRARLTIERDGSLHLKAAEDVAPDELQSFLASKREWIYRKLAEKEVVRHEAVTKELVNGEGFMYLGRNYQLRLADRETRPRVRLERGRLLLPADARRGDPQPIIEWYERRGEAWLRPRLADWARRLRVDPASLDVVNLGYKWGAASTGNRIRIHWATMQLSPSLVDYVLAHELAHLQEPHHGPAFWQLLGRAMPDCHERKQELARRGAGLWLGNTSLEAEDWSQ
jgi:predicted metal-dependent hydrolase